MDPITIALGLAQVAPILISWFGGSDKSVKVAEKAISIATAVTGKSSGEEALKELQVNPDLVIAFRTKVLEQEFNFAQLVIEDRKSARERDTAFVQNDRYNFRADLLAFLSVAGLIICVYFVARDSDLPERAVNAIMFVAGILASCVRDVYGFEFGSSASSKEKSATIADLIKSK